MNIPVTAIISTKNEERAIEQCIAGLRAFDEIIVVDSGSSDRTQEISGRLGVRVVDFQWGGRYPKKKQWCLDNLDTASPWIFFVDADESPTPELLHEMETLFKGPEPEVVAAFDITLSYHFMGRELRHGHRVIKRALLHRDRVEFPEVADLDAPGMGELEGHYQPIARGAVQRLSARLKHDDPDPLGSWVWRHNLYADWEAYLRCQTKTRESVQQLRSKQGRLFDRVPGKPLAFFLYSYVFRLGFLDGHAGFDYAFGLSFYYWLINAKTRELHRRSS
jgi:glycosyltransferase involved in cell wall biosynthesis